MKKILSIMLMIIAIASLSIGLHKVQAAGEPKLDLSITVDTSSVKTNKKVYATVKITNVENIDTSNPLALTATLEYIPTLLKNPTIEGGTNWSAALNNGIAVLDCSSFTNNQTIATITFDVVESQSLPATATIALANVDISNDDNYNETKTLVESPSFTIPSLDDSGSRGEGEPMNFIPNPAYVEPTNTVNRNANNVVNEVNEITPNNTVQVVNKIDPVKDETTSNKPIPQTGVSIAIYVVIAIVTAIGIYTYIREKKFYD